MSSNEPEFNPDERAKLHNMARESIRHGLKYKQSLPIEIDEYSSYSQENRASFVTLTKNSQLRGCIGTLEAFQPLVKDVIDHAFAAAFQDPRFPSLQPQELDEIEIKISVLSPPEPMIVKMEVELLQQIRPDIDGLILQDDLYKATFLPSVWEQLPNPEDFIAYLKRKAGLRANYWSDTLQVWRYTTEEF